MNRRDPLLRTAGRIARALGRGATAAAGDPARISLQDLSDLFDAARLAERLDRLRRRAVNRGWHLAAAVIWTDVLREVHAVGRYAGTVPTGGAQPSRSSLAVRPPSLRCLVEDLRQLGDEFEAVEFDNKGGRVVATTKSIELEGVPLGPFAIELHLKRLADRQDFSCFDCVAPKPNPASGNHSVTHPHVQDRQLCAGEASAPIAAALQQGRICDAFCLVHSVLQTYNPASPYVALDAWDGVTCSDCGCSTSRENTSGCEHCDQDYCDECMGCCDACDSSCCHGCLERDREADSDLCPSCRTSCGECGRVVNSEDVEGASGLCPQCRERLEEEQEQDTQPEDPHDPDFIESADAGQPATASPATLAEQPAEAGRAAA